MADIVRLRAQDGTAIEYVDQVIGTGAMKEVYFTPDKRHVVAFYMQPVDAPGQERLAMIVGDYRERIFAAAHGDYWRRLFCWPERIVEDQKGRLGMLMPSYPGHFFFQYGSVREDFLGIKDKEKEGKWFSTPANRLGRLHEQERGHWLNYLRICLNIARAVRRLHAAGLAHSDLSYKNVLIAPTVNRACVIDCDGLVVPGKYPPDVVGTPDFIAPEVVASAHLARDDPKRSLPSIRTDRHALAVLIYQYLLLRHPLRGAKVHAQDPREDERLGMGERALFVEHEQDPSNRIRAQDGKAIERPWLDTASRPYTITGPYLAALFRQAFIEGLHQPDARPSANDWEMALVKTLDLIQPCSNPACPQQWYVFDNQAKPHCPFCGEPYHGELPVINFYSERGQGRFLSDEHRLMVYRDQSLFPWHVDRSIIPNERLSQADTDRVGYFIHHHGRWLLVNQTLEVLKDASTGVSIPKGREVELVDGLKLLVKRGEHARLLHVQMAQGT